MKDVFISYARSTETEAKRIVDALRAAGQAVWIDDQLPRASRLSPGDQDRRAPR